MRFIARYTGFDDFHRADGRQRHRDPADRVPAAVGHVGRWPDGGDCRRLRPGAGQRGDPPDLRAADASGHRGDPGALPPGDQRADALARLRHRPRPARTRLIGGGDRFAAHQRHLLGSREHGSVSVAVTFLGAAREVTGSCILVQAGRTRFLVDCGMFQGGSESDAKNARPFPVPLSTIDFVLSTHAHLDHSGLLPKIVRDGYRGPVYATTATADLLRVMLPDSGHIQEREAEWQSKKARRAGSRNNGEPLYTEADALATLPRLSTVGYGQRIEPAPGVSARFQDAGHILGSAIVSVTVRDGGKDRELVFTGDLGHRGLPIVRDPALIDRADLLVMESTYGNRVHKGMEATIEEFVHAVTDTLQRKGGNVIIPSFAVGRAQDIIFLLADLTRRGRISGITLYIDSPLAAQATQVTLR